MLEARRIVERMVGGVVGSGEGEGEGKGNEDGGVRVGVIGKEETKGVKGVLEGDVEGRKGFVER